MPPPPPPAAAAHVNSQGTRLEHNGRDSNHAGASSTSSGSVKVEGGRASRESSSNGRAPAKKQKRSSVSGNAAIMATGKESKPVVSTGEGSTPAGPPYVCPICATSYSRLEYLRRHERRRECCDRSGTHVSKRKSVLLTRHWSTNPCLPLRRLRRRRAALCVRLWEGLLKKVSCSRSPSVRLRGAQR